MYCSQKGSKGRKLFGKLGSSKDDLDVVNRKGMIHCVACTPLWVAILCQSWPIEITCQVMNVGRSNVQM